VADDLHPNGKRVYSSPPVSRESVAGDGGNSLHESNRRELPMEPSKEVFVSTGEEYVNDRKIFRKLVNWVKKAGSKDIPSLEVLTVSDSQLVFSYLGRTWAIRHRFVFEKDNVKSLLCSFAGGEDNGKFIEQTTLLMDGFGNVSTQDDPEDKPWGIRSNSEKVFLWLMTGKVPPAGRAPR
jgi:hypothetical protein